MYPAEVSRTDAVKQVLLSLLTNRFKLQIKHETKELPVYELVLAKNGPKIARGETAGRCLMSDIGPGNGRWQDVRSCPFPTFAGLFSVMPELRSRVLVDKTGLRGRLARAPLIRAQSATADWEKGAGGKMSFEVASIKKHGHEDNGGPTSIFMGGADVSQFHVSNLTAKMLIASAYSVKDFQISGGPSWINSERWDIDAKVEDSLAAQLQKFRSSSNERKPR